MRKQSAAHIYKNLKEKEAWLLEKANVVGCGIGEKIKAGLPLGRICLKVYVEKKLPLNKLAKRDIIPRTLSLIETDIEEVGKIRALQSLSGFTSRYRPALGGVSLGHYRITAGTFGCLVKDKATQGAFILSNNHVLANSNKAQEGDSILQPAPYDGGSPPKDIIGTLERWVEIKFGKEANLVDAALARPKNLKLVKPEIMEIGAPIGIIKPKLGMLIQKSGRTTGYTAGKVKDISATIKVTYDKKDSLIQKPDPYHEYLARR